MEFLLEDKDSNASFAYNLSIRSNAKLIFQQPSEHLRVFGKAVEALNVFGIPIIIFIGCIGNTLSLIVFCATHLKWHSSTVYLMFLNLMDTVFLLCLILTWLGYLDLHFIHGNGWCQITLFLSYVSGFLSVYAVVGFTVERWIVVYYPLKKTAWCTRKRAGYIVVGLGLFSIIMYSYTLWGSGVMELGNSGLSLCLPKEQFYTFFQIMAVLDTIMTLLLPSVAIVILNVCITCKIWRFMYQRRLSNGGVRVNFNFSSKPSLRPLGTTLESTTLTFNQSNIVSHQIIRIGHASSSRQRLQLRTTRSLIVVSTVFVLLNLPSHAFRIGAVTMELSDPSFMYSREALLWQHVCQIIYYSNFALNYFLYCACSKSFRVASLKLLKRFPWRLHMRWNMN